VLAVERRIKVLERIAADQAVEVSTLAREFGVSEMTIRRDLRRLDRDGFVRRTYGGATTRVVRAARSAIRRFSGALCSVRALWVASKPPAARTTRVVAPP